MTETGGTLQALLHWTVVLGRLSRAHYKAVFPTLFHPFAVFYLRPRGILVVMQETVSQDESRTPRTLCYTGLSRLVGQAVPIALQYADTEDVRIHTVFVYENDPKLDKVAAQLEAVHASGSLHATPVVIAVPSAQKCVMAGDDNTRSSLDSEDEAAETDFKYRMASLQRRMVCTLVIIREGRVIVVLITIFLAS